MADVKNLSTENFDSEVLQSKIPVLVDFWAPWCGPCKTLGPILDTMAVENADSINIAKVNVDENKDLAVKYGVRGIPTMIIFKDGKEVKRTVGAQGKAPLQKMIDEAIV